MVKLELLGVAGPDRDRFPLVLLRHEDRVLPIVIGPAEAQAIQLGLSREKPPRPLTHDLICNLLAGLRGRLESVTIYRLENDTFYAHLNVAQKNAEGEVEQILRIDSRPSDGIALAVRVGCPIYAAEEVLERAGQDASALYSHGEEDEEIDFSDEDDDDEGLGDSDEDR
jgi:bifunctional DNase/RNase